MCVLEREWAQCTGENFWENSTFEPPAPLLDEDECLDTAPCFHTKNWEFFSDDILYAVPIKNGEVMDYHINMGLNNNGVYVPLTCEGNCPSSLGI